MIPRVLQWNPSKPATLGTSESILIRGVAGEIAFFGTFRSGLNSGVATFQGS